MTAATRELRHTNVFSGDADGLALQILAWGNSVTNKKFCKTRLGNADFAVLDAMRQNPQMAAARGIDQRFLYAGRSYPPHRNTNGSNLLAISSNNRRVSGCNGGQGARGASQAITPPAFINALAARKPA